MIAPPPGRPLTGLCCKLRPRPACQPSKKATLRSESRGRAYNAANEVSRAAGFRNLGMRDLRAQNSDGTPSPRTQAICSSVWATRRRMSGEGFRQYDIASLEHILSFDFRDLIDHPLCEWVRASWFRGFMSWDRRQLPPATLTSPAATWIWNIPQAARVMAALPHSPCCLR